MKVRDSIEKTSFAAEWDFVDGRRTLPILMAIPITMLSGLEPSVFEGRGACPLVTRRVGN
jgi:hypothetical protein